jgi:hypothetical protein
LPKILAPAYKDDKRFLILGHFHETTNRKYD